MKTLASGPQSLAIVARASLSISSLVTPPKRRTSFRANTLYTVSDFYQWNYELLPLEYPPSTCQPNHEAVDQKHLVNLSKSTAGDEFSVDNAGHLTRSPFIVRYISCRIFHVYVFSNDGQRDDTKAQFWSRKDFKGFAGWCMNVKGKATAHKTRLSMWLYKEAC